MPEHVEPIRGAQGLTEAGVLDMRTPSFFMSALTSAIHSHSSLA